MEMSSQGVQFMEMWKKKKYGNNRSKVMSKASENEKLQFQASTIDLETHETKQTWIKWIYSHNQ